MGPHLLATSTHRFGNLRPSVTMENIRVVQSDPHGTTRMFLFLSLSY